MTGPGASGNAATFGLCASCRHASFFRSARDVTYVACERSRTDARFAKFPGIPVLECPGFEERSEESPRNPNDEDALQDS